MDKQYVQETSDAKLTDRLKKKMKSLKEERPKIKQQQRRQSAAEATQSRVDKQQQRHRERRHSEAQKARGLEMKEQQVTTLPGVHVVDLTATIAPVTSDSAASMSESASAAVTLNGAKLRPTRVLNPGERELDEAIWTAFKHNDFSKFFQIHHSQRPEIRGNPVTFQRPADGGTILMAAAMHGRVDVIEPVLGASSASVLQQDWEGSTPAVFAHHRGHSSVHAALLACEESEREKDYVYDVYCMDVSSALTSPEASTTDDQELKDAPIVSVSSTVQRWLSQDASLQPNGDDDHVQEYMLESDAENDDADRYVVMCA